MGTYTQITQISAPSSAHPGDTVNITVTVKNVYSSYILCYASGKYDSAVFSLSPSNASPIPGATASFSGLFTMPNNSVRVYIYSYVMQGGVWQLDDQAYVDISLVALTPAVSQFQIVNFNKV